jgi:hypothetical protein
MLVLEQSAEPRPETKSAEKLGWRLCWQGVKPVYPIVVAGLALLLELASFHLWLEDKLFSLEGLLRLLLAIVLPFLAVPVAIGVGVLFALLLGALLPKGERAKRRLCLEEKRIRLSPSSISALRWKHVRRCLIEPVPGQAGFVTLTIEIGRNASTRFWSIVLDGRDQKHAFLSEMECLRQFGRVEVPIVELSQPRPKRAAVTQGIWMLAIGLWLFFHGFPVLMGGVFFSTPREAHPTSEFTPAEEAKLSRAMISVVRQLHIRNAGQFRILLLISGGTLTGAAILLLTRATQLQNRRRREVDRLYEEELQGITIWQSSPTKPEYGGLSAPTDSCVRGG